MAFHVACPITCQRICFCSLGFPLGLRTDKSRNEFLETVATIEALRADPSLHRPRDSGTVQVLVPKVVPPPPPPPLLAEAALGDEDEVLLSAKTKRAAMQRKAAVASMVAEDYARRFESGAMPDASGDLPGEDQGQSNVKVMCRLCYFGENEGSERARKMLSCKSCGKKYHRSCLKAWSQHRDLFHWSSWTCPSCRICEVCRRTGDQTKFMFCKRCDGAYHCYCQHPPHKNVSSGPYLCPKHTRCHSCGSTVPGNGLSTRWFLGYTCCDACGRLFVKGNYCPVCLKVYRDSESTPMVCCDVCQRWVHCQCDEISDEKYLQFQVDGNLHYICAMCRGECYQVRDLEDAVQELWRRRDKADSDLIANLRAAAGLPTQEEIFSISPYSDDEDSGPILKNEYSRSLKFSLKALVDKSPKKTKEYGKKSSNKKHNKKKGYIDPSSVGYSGDDDKNGDMQSHKSGEPFSSPVAGSLSEGICSINHAGVLKHKLIDEVTAGNESMKSKEIQIKGTKTHGMGIGDDTGIDATKSKNTITKGPKLVIHLGGRNRNATTSPKSDASSYQREQELTASNGYSDELKGTKLKGKKGKSIKIRKINSDNSDMNPKVGEGNVADGYESVSPVKPRVSLGKRSFEDSTVAVGTATEGPGRRGGELSLRNNADARPEVFTDGSGDTGRMPLGSPPLRSDSKPLLKLKFKNPYHENHSSWTSQGEDEKSSVKGQRSKRKRPGSLVENAAAGEDQDTSQRCEDTMDEIMDANWILQKLGKDAIGKRVEVHQPSDNSWHKGMVKDVSEGASIISVALDDGSTRNLELGKQGIRFVSQKQKRRFA
ncbi:uncharacterized protein LOC127787255 [Diospyros lotus]|uniref:uncharacterized protein LOC127787255 n=1 Tax=Diospyros lotus TaxID=55363 RepID=UPI002253481B|nr:uncharacterized protein LOC127787255 [Diospyros lotus]